MRNVSDKICKQDKNTDIMFNYFFQKSCRLGDNAEKCCITEQATDDDTAHAHCMLDT